MLRKLSYAPDDRLTYYVARIREIAAHDDVAATIEVDKLLAEIVEEDENWCDDDSEHTAGNSGPPPNRELYFATREFYQMQEFAPRLRRSLSDNEPLTLHSLHRVNGFLRQATPELREQLSFPEDYDKLIEEVRAVEAPLREHLIKQQMNRTMTHRHSARAILSKCAEIEKVAPAHITDQHRGLLRQAKERACWFRAKQKVSEAKIARSAGGDAKAERLTKEARLLLAQDWHDGFPDETPPAIDDVAPGGK